ncbi:MAG: GNAT family N-acetyltransferase [Neptuniibacter sp.]
MPIRKAIANDSQGLQECMKQAYSVYLDRMKGKSLPPIEVDYAQEIKQYPVWVVEVDDHIAGGIILSFESEYLSVANLSVHPDFQGQGFGSSLLDFARKKAIEQGYKEMRLATHVLLTENISLYKHLGWREYDRDDMRVYMKKTVEL